MPDAGAAGSPVGLPRRLAAVVYDALIVFALLFITTFILLQLFGGRLDATGKWTLQACSLLIAYLYFAWFWTHGGQTIGMRAWRFRLVNGAGRAPGWSRASLRFVSALLSWICAGLGFLWSLWDSEGRAWHDRLSGTRLLKY